LDGRRYVSGVPGSSAVDLNTIPSQFIERVEIMTGGASSVYGSDAVAGVVNFVLKDDFEGVEFEGQYGESSEGDDESRQFSFTSGLTTGDGKGQAMFHLGYSDQGAVFSRDPNFQVFILKAIRRQTRALFLKPLIRFSHHFRHKGVLMRAIHALLTIQTTTYRTRLAPMAVTV